MSKPSQPGPGQVPPQGRPTPEEIAEIRARLTADAEKAGMTVPEFIEHIKKQQAQMMQQRMAAQGQHSGQAEEESSGQHQEATQQPIEPGPPKPAALALGKFLQSQDLKPRTVILNGQRKEMFRVKRALRTLQLPSYEKARSKNPLLPEITDRASLENTFKLLPLSMLALRVSKIEEDHTGHSHGKKKRVKGQWTVKIEPQQEAGDDMYYVWLWEGTQLMRKVYAGLALLAIFLIVLYPLWPLKMRQGVYYLSWGFLAFLGLFFAMAIFRVILFAVTYFVLPPGLWLYPNLWEDVSVVDSFKPFYAWHDSNPNQKKKKKPKTGGGGGGSSRAGAMFSAATAQPAPATARTTATDTQVAIAPQQRYATPKVEELGDQED